MSPETRWLPDQLSCRPVLGIGEVLAGEDLAATLSTALGPDALADGDVVVLTSKVVSKAEGRQVAGDRAALVEEQAVRVLARRGRTRIVRTRHGLVLAAAGIDASNTATGYVLLLPEDPDWSARRLRERLTRLTRRNIAIVVTDTAGRAWRQGQVDLAIGVAGLAPLHDYSGAGDGYGNELSVTAPAVADEIAAAAELVTGKLGRRPAAVVRGLAGWVLPPGRHGPGAAALVRAEDEDLFGLGAREAVLAALMGDPAQRAGFGGTADAATLAGVLEGLGAAVSHDGERVDVALPGDPRARGRLEGATEAAAYACGWRAAAGPFDRTNMLRLERSTP